jgi:hypothetical protein
VHDYWYNPKTTDLDAFRKDANSRMKELPHQESTIHHHPHGTECDGFRHENYQYIGAETVPPTTEDGLPIEFTVRVNEHSKILTWGPSA